MLDADRWLEDRLRVALREEAAALPFTLTLEDLERRLAERRSARRRIAVMPAWWFAAAALVIVGVAAFVGAALMTQDRTPPPIPPPVESPAPTTLPSTSQLLADVPGAIVRLEAMHVPGLDGATPPPDDRFLLGQAAVGGAFVYAISCIGGPTLMVEVGDLNGGSYYSSTPVDCNGETLIVPSSRTNDGPLPVVVRANPSTAWAIAVADLAPAQAEVPSFPPVTLTDGWIKVVDSEPTLASPGQGTGVRVAVPPGSQRVAAWFSCRGDAPATATLGEASAALDCSTDVATRLETDATGVEELQARVESEGLIWAAITVETETALEMTYPSAPPLPADVAAATWAAFGSDYLTMGTIGGAPRLVALPSHQAHAARDGLVAVAVSTDEPPSGTVHLVSVPDGEIISTPVDTDGYVGPPWLDPTHDQVIYGKRAPVAFEFRRVGLDGGGDRLLATVPLGPHPDGELASFGGEIAKDDSVFVLEVCRDSGACERTIVDLASLDVTTTDVTDAPICSIVGIIDGLIVGYRFPACANGPDVHPGLVVAPLDGGPELVVGDIGLSGGGVVTRTSEGPVLVGIRMAADGSRYEIVEVDLRTGEARTLLEEEGADMTFLTPLPVELPDGYVLLGMSLGDEPAQRGFFIRPVPILLDLETGERTELPNLPHTLEPGP